MPTDRENRLPRWAQAELRNLRETIDGLRADATRTVDDTNTIARDYVEQVDAPLRPGQPVRFLLPPITTPDGITQRDLPWIEVRVEDGRVWIRSGNSACLSLAPVTANSVSLSAVYR